MSVIAFKRGVLASDSMVLNGQSSVLGETDKIHIVTSKLLGEGLLGMEGNIYYMEYLKGLIVEDNKFLKEGSWKNNYYENDENSSGNSDAGAIFIPKHEAIKSMENPDHSTMFYMFSYQNGGPVVLRNQFFAFGSGAHIAMGAMGHGASALEAVGVTCGLLPSLCGEPCRKVSF